MKITLKHYNETITIETEHDDHDLNSVLEMVQKLLVAAGYTWLANGELYYEEKETTSKD